MPTYVDYSDTYGEHIRLNRLYQGWTQEQLAEKLDVSVKTLQNWETNRHTPGKAAQARISELFGGVDG